LLGKDHNGLNALAPGTAKLPETLPSILQMDSKNILSIGKTGEDPCGILYVSSAFYSGISPLFV
jgi:hypothetical protein